MFCLSFLICSHKPSSTEHGSDRVLEALSCTDCWEMLSVGFFSRIRQHQSSWTWKRLIPVVLVQISAHRPSTKWSCHHDKSMASRRIFKFLSPFLYSSFDTALPNPETLRIASVSLSCLLWVFCFHQRSFFMNLKF